MNAYFQDMSNYWTVLSSFFTSESIPLQDIHYSRFRFQFIRTFVFQENKLKGDKLLIRKSPIF